MGILDDAIREHLDLKRSHGAEDTELARLEGEAFGPPSRPDDPDFPEQDSPEGQAAVATEDAPAQLETGQLEVAPPTGEAPALEAPPAADEAPAPAAPEPPAELSAPPAEPEAPATPEPPAAAERTAEPEDQSSPGGAFYDQEGQLDLALELDEELPPEAKAPPGARRRTRRPSSANCRPDEPAAHSRPPSERGHRAWSTRPPDEPANRTRPRHPLRAPSRRSSGWTPVRAPLRRARSAGRPPTQRTVEAEVVDGEIVVEEDDEDSEDRGRAGGDPRARAPVSVGCGRRATGSSRANPRTSTSRGRAGNGGSAVGDEARTR